MSRWRPSPAEERWLEVASELGAAVPPAAMAERTGGWRSTGPLARVALFVRCTTPAFQPAIQSPWQFAHSEPVVDVTVVDHLRPHLVLDAASLWQVTAQLTALPDLVM